MKGQIQDLVALSPRRGGGSYHRRLPGLYLSLFRPQWLHLEIPIVIQLMSKYPLIMTFRMLFLVYKNRVLLLIRDSDILHTAAHFTVYV